MRVAITYVCLKWVRITGGWVVTGDGDWYVRSSLSDWRCCGGGRDDVRAQSEFIMFCEEDE